MRGVQGCAYQDAILCQARLELIPQVLGQDFGHQAAGLAIWKMGELLVLGKVAGHSLLGLLQPVQGRIAQQSAPVLALLQLDLPQAVGQCASYLVWPLKEQAATCVMVPTNNSY